MYIFIINFFFIVIFGIDFIMRLPDKIPAVAHDYTTQQSKNKNTFHF